jgi:hypothetical protein
MHACTPQNSNPQSNKKVTTSRCSTNQTSEWESAPNDSVFPGKGCMRYVHASGVGRRNLICVLGDEATGRGVCEGDMRMACGGELSEIDAAQ